MTMEKSEVNAAMFKTSDCWDKLLNKFDNDVQSYFEGVVKFLIQNKWIYDFRITDIFSSQVPDNIPQEWHQLKMMSYEELDCIVSADVQDFWPPSLVEYVLRAQDYTLERDVQHSAGFHVIVGKEVERGISAKKRHEITCMARLIDSCCTKAKANSILDIGAGLGYLDQVVHRNFGYQIIGLEAVDVRTHKAEQRAIKQGCGSGSGIVQKKMMLTEEMTDSLLQVVQELKEMSLTKCNCHNLHSEPNNGDNVTMMGLHCCGNLAPTMIKMFAKHEDIKCMCCIGCCYHVMSAGRFPMSDGLRQVLAKHQSFTLSTYALRLASQETKSRWLKQTDVEHEEHTRNVAYRAILQVYADRCGIKLRKRKRRGANRCDFESFDHYLRAVACSYNVAGASIEHFCKEMKSTLNEFKDWVSYIEFITALQVIMQPVLESLIIMDRCLYLKEQQLDVYLLPVFEDLISPRNMAIVAFKPP